MQNIDLRSLGRYRFAIEQGGRAADPWALLLLCRHGHIYLHGPRTLGAATNNRGSIATRLAALPCVQVMQEGDDGINAIFDVADFKAVAAIMRPRTQRQLSAEHKAKLIAAGKRFRRESSDDSGERQGVGVGRDDSEAA
jgi:hypothetical protein